MNPRVAVIATGSELMRGRSTDTHLAFFARRLEAAGLEIDFHATCGDDFGRIVDEIKLAVARADIIILSGGLGPTEDDLTRAAAEEAFHRPLEFRADLWREIAARFGKFKIPMAAINKRQAFVPKGAKVMKNPNGSAPGFSIKADGVKFFALPGPPREMIPMFDRYVIPAVRLKRSFEIWESRTCGLPEADVDEIVRPIVARHRGASYGLTVKAGTVNITIRTEGSKPDPMVRALRKRLGACLVGPCSLEEAVAGLLGPRTIAIAESCTGGRIADKLTDVPGISANLLEGCIVYSNRSKTARLGVPAELIAEHGAVSPEVAAAMAEGIARSSGADIGVATTGIAGPGGGSRDKPAGLVYHAVRYGGKTAVERRVFPGERTAVKDRSANWALNMVRLALLPGERNVGTEVGLRDRRSGRRR